MERPILIRIQLLYRQIQLNRYYNKCQYSQRPRLPQPVFYFRLQINAWVKLEVKCGVSNSPTGKSRDIQYSRGWRLKRCWTNCRALSEKGEFVKCFCLFTPTKAGGGLISLGDGKSPYHPFSLLKLCWQVYTLQQMWIKVVVGIYCCNKILCSKLGNIGCET